MLCLVCASPIDIGNIKYSEELGMYIKKEGIAVDVVNLLSPMKKDCYCYKERIETFVAAANKDDNSHIKHVRPHAWTLSRDVLLSRKPKFISDASLEEEEIRRLETKKKQERYKRAQLTELEEEEEEISDDASLEEEEEEEEEGTQLMELDSTSSKAVGVKQPSNVEYVEAAFKASDNNNEKAKMGGWWFMFHPFWLLCGCLLFYAIRFKSL
ncbi:uncharacterized protein [Rutidosis leptorrhynchoides]|uniref:uncharacterized protein n=1 Tax=Rutidosis leptorrhynchoides TaxID=125765 RepID=UPI003A98F9CB